MADGWFYTHGGKTHGPVSTDEVKRLAAAGTLLAEDLLWPASVPHQLAVAAGIALDFATLAPPKAAVPDWLSDVQQAEKPRSKAPSAPKGEPPDWLNGPGRVLREPNAQPSAASDWLNDLQAAAPTTAPPGGALPDWLDSPCRQEQTAKPAPTPVKSAVPLAAPGVPPRAQPVPPAPPRAAPSAPPVVPLATPVRAGSPPVPQSPPRALPPAASKPPTPEARPAAAAAAKPPTGPLRATTLNLGDATPEEMGFNPDTGQVLDPVKFKQWQQGFLSRDRERRAAIPGGPAIDPYDKARTELANWIDLDRNRSLVATGDLEAIRQDPFVQEFMRGYKSFGPEMLERLDHYLEFLVENRKKFQEDSRRDG